MQYRFAGYVFDDERGLEGARGRIPLRQRDARFLGALLGADGRIVSKNALVDAVWGGAAVSDDSIVQVARRIRLALSTPDATKIVETVYGAGLRIAVPVDRVDAGGRGATGTGSAARRIEAEACLTSARETSAGRSRAKLAAAIDAARRALELDLDYVAAWCALAEFHVMRVTRSIEMPRVGGAAAVAAAGQALAREPRCGPALAVRGFVRATIERDTDAGLADLDASVRVDPGYWVSRGLRGWALVSVGRVEEAVREVRRGIELNPWAHWYSGLLAQYQLFAGDRKSAIRTARDAVARFPDIDYAYFAASQVASALDLHDEAIAFGEQAMRLAPDTPLLHTALATALARAGRRQESLALARSIERAPEPLPAVWLAACWLALGRRDRAVEWLRLARDQGAPQYAYAAYDPQLCALEDGPRDAVHRPGPVASRA